MTSRATALGTELPSTWSHPDTGTRVSTNDTAAGLDPVRSPKISPAVMPKTDGSAWLPRISPSTGEKSGMGAPTGSSNDVTGEDTLKTTGGWEERFQDPGRTVGTTLEPFAGGITVEKSLGRLGREEAEEIPRRDSPVSDVSAVQPCPAFSHNSGFSNSLPPGCSVITEGALKEIGKLLHYKAYSEAVHALSVSSVSKMSTQPLPLESTEKESTMGDYLGLASSIANGLVMQAATGYVLSHATGLFGSAVSALGSAAVDSLVVPAISAATSLFR